MADPAATRARRVHDPDEVDALSRAERGRLTSELLLEAHAMHDESRRADLLDEVILINRCVAEAVANRYRGRGVSDQDLHQSAFEGLVKAVHKFDPTVRPDLLTYAVPRSVAKCSGGSATRAGWCGLRAGCRSSSGG